MLILNVFFSVLAAAEGPADPRALACAVEMIARVTAPRSALPPAYFKVRRPDPTNSATSAVGARVLPLRPSGHWMWVPINEPFALDTYTSLHELQTWLDGYDPPERIIARLKLPPSLADRLVFDRYAPAFARRLAILLHARGRSLHCFDEHGDPVD